LSGQGNLPFNGVPAARTPADWYERCFCHSSEGGMVIAIYYYVAGAHLSKKDRYWDPRQRDVALCAAKEWGGVGARRTNIWFPRILDSQYRNDDLNDVCDAIL
jgi:hypothetical protein